MRYPHPLLVLAFAATSLFCHDAGAQGKLSLAPVAAPFSSYADSPSEDFLRYKYKYSTGITAGATVQYHFSPAWSLGTGFWYQWAFSKSQANIFDAFIRKKQQYLEIPVLLNLRTSPKKVSPYFTGGLLLSKEQGSYRAWASKLLLGAGLSYQLSPQCMIVAQPTLVLGSDKFDKDFFPPKRLLSFQTQLVYRIPTLKERK